MEVLGNAPSSHQPTFCNLARCRRPWPQRRGGACRSMQQQDRAIRAGGAPVRGKSERRADGAAIDWRTARSSNRRRPRSDAPRNRRKRHSRRPWRAPSVSINKEIELGVRGRWPPLSECTICSDPASRSSSCREVGCAALQTIRREYAAPPHGSRALAERGVFADTRILPRVILVAGLRTPHFICGSNDFSILAPKWSRPRPTSPTFLQWTVLQTINSRSRCDRRLKEAGSERSPPSRHGCLLSKMTRAPIAALSAEQIEHAPCL